MRRLLFLLAASSACVSTVAALPHPAAHSKLPYAVVPLEPGQGTQDRQVSSISTSTTRSPSKTKRPARVTKTVVKTPSPATVTHTVVKSPSPATRTVIKTVPVPTPEPLPSKSQFYVPPAASWSSAVGPQQPPPLPTPAGTTPEAPACVNGNPAAPACLAPSDVSLVNITPAASAPGASPTTLGTVVVPPQPVVSAPPSSSTVPDWNNQVPPPYPAWNGTVESQQRWA